MQVTSPGWKKAAASRGGAARAGDLQGVPAAFLTERSRVADEAVLVPPPPTRDAAARPLQITHDVPPDRTAILVVRHPSGALTFHRPVESTTRGARGPSQLRFQVAVRVPPAATRGVVGAAIKATVIEVAKIAADKAASFILPTLAAAVESAIWKKKGIREGWFTVTKDALATGTLAAGAPISPQRSLLFLHGTFSSAAAAFGALATSTLFDRVKDVYGDRLFAFNHFSISKTPEQNAAMLLDGLPDQTTTFDVVAYSRGGLVLRNLVERAEVFGDRARRFALGRAVLVASPNEGTPLATPTRWDEALGWIANLLEMFPDNPFTTGAAFVANGLEWIANHVLGDLPGLHAMDVDGDPIANIQAPPGPPSDAYSALVSNYQPTGAILQRLLDAGIDQFFGSANDLVVPSEGGWRVDRTPTPFVPAARIGCFGPGGNIGQDPVTHLGFFSRPETVDFLVNGLLGHTQPLNSVDPRKPLPDRRLLRGAVPAEPRAAAEPPAEKRRAAPPLRITVVNGDLTFERDALLIGHYRAAKLTGTEAAMNRMIGGAMERSLDVGVYPVAVGTNKIFINNRPDLERGSFLPRPKAVIVAGLGEEGKLQAARLAQTVQQAVIEWAQRLAEDRKRAPESFELATTLIGSGGPGISAGDSARLIAQGVHDANALLTDDNAKHDKLPHVSHLRFIELFLDRATDAWRALRLQQAATPGRYEIDQQVMVGTGPLLRPSDSGYRGADYDFISVETVRRDGPEPELSYTLDTRRARSEVRAQRPQSTLLADLVATGSNDRNRDTQIGRTLFDLLIPVELEAYLTGSGEMQIELDAGTAAIPWELLDTDADPDPDREPWAIKVKLLRKLRVEGFREQVWDANADEHVLVIGEPECPHEYPRLYGARNEAIAVRTCLTGADALDPSFVRDLISADPSQVGADARTVVNALFERPWRIVHIAGHGMQPQSNGTAGGVVLSNGSFLGPTEFSNMRAVPELVFVNCCHLATSGSDKLLQSFDRARFASGVAEALIRIGVRCVVAAGWAVDDEAASAFAETFYESLLRRNRFIDAVAEARKAARAKNPDVNTWAAYQCYGDPDWIFRRSTADPNRFSVVADQDFSGVASANALRLTLEQIVVQTKFQGYDPAAQVDTLRKLEGLFTDKFGASGSVAELFGEAFFETGDVARAIEWYERAVAATDGRGSMKAAEQLANARSRLAWELVDAAQRHLDAMGARTPARTASARAAARRAQAAARRSLRQAAVRAHPLIDAALSLLVKLLAIDESMERYSLVGSAYKRRALVDAAGRPGRVRQDLLQMRAAYQKACRAGVHDGAADLSYPASNCLVADAALHAGARRRLDPEMLDIVRQSLDAKTDADFWSVAGGIELQQYEALAGRRLSAAQRQIEKAYEDLHDRVATARMWSSIYDTACLVFPNYARRVRGREQKAAVDLLVLLRRYAHPGVA